MMKGDRKSRKAQSAMEYLMTYGWAILVIAVVLAALFELGVFNGGTLPNVCVGQSGFQCSLVAISSTGNLIINFGQVSSNTWTSANFVMFNSASISTTGTSTMYTTAADSNVITNLAPGTTVSLVVPEPWISSSTPTTISGQLWVQYVVNGGTYYAEVGTITGKS